MKLIAEAGRDFEISLHRDEDCDVITAKVKLTGQLIAFAKTQDKEHLVVQEAASQVAEALLAQIRGS